MPDEWKYEINQVYRDKNSTTDEADQYMHWINSSLGQHWGITNTKGISTIRDGENNVHFLKFQISGDGTDTPWVNQIDLEGGEIRYWTDARKPEGEEDYTPGKDALARYEDVPARERPPVLVFEKPESGKVVFKGLCVIADIERKRMKNSDGEIIHNYRVNLVILDTDSVKVDWITQRTREGDDSKAPEAWQKWIKTGQIDQYSVYESKIRDYRDQQPTEEDWTILEHIREVTERVAADVGTNKGTVFEYMVRDVLNSLGSPGVDSLKTGVLHGSSGLRDFEVTPGSADRGVDLKGEIEIFESALLDVNSTVPCKVQVKNNKWKDDQRGANKCGPKDVSRLASRVNPGEVGIFITTSGYTTQAQREAVESYPIILLSGQEVVRLFKNSALLSTEGKLDGEYLERVKESITE